jgi:hypothetical protein
MHPSSTYQYILDEGAIRELKRMLMRLGRKRFGPPSEADGAALELVGDLERLERITERVHEVASWQEFLSTP